MDTVEIGSIYSMGFTFDMSSVVAMTNDLYRMNH
jgi:hypothetical protein